MSLVVFFVLAALAAIAVAYPLLTPRVPAEPEARISDAQVEGAVQRLRRARKRGEPVSPGADRVCPACSAPYQPGDRFCVRCGQTLPEQGAAPTPAQAAVCPSCGAALREDDLFCARCGHRLPTPTGGGGLEEVQP
ncbi:MAG: zinc ribbon domain-containing protein [Chloroflexi bacterium]|nr:MAG: zinc ribbon domain-containing protein [Chloroflexota bacterium]